MNKFELLVDHERMYLGAILNDPTLIDESQVTPKQFVDDRHRTLFHDMQELKQDDQEITPISLAGLGESRSMRWGGTSYLGQLMASCPSVHGFKNYESHIVGFHTVQDAQQAVNEFLNNTKEAHKTKELQQLITDINKLEGLTSDQLTFKKLLEKRVTEHYDSLKAGLSGTDTGFKELNTFTDGWQPSDLIIIGARPSMGKTSLVLNSVLKATKKSDVFGTVFSIEMAKEQIIDRLIAAEGKINLMKMRNPNKSFTNKEWERHAEAVGVLERSDLDIRDDYTTPSIRSAIRKNIKENPNKKHIAVIDFLTLIKPVNPSDNTHKDITEIIWDLKQTAKDLKVPIVVLAQLNRGVEQRQDKRPVMSDIRESGSVEQIADVIGFLYRDEYYNPDTDQVGITELIIAKNRNGSTGTIELKFEKETNTFHDLS